MTSMWYYCSLMINTTFFFYERMVLVQGNQMVPHPPTPRFLFFKHLKLQKEYAFNRTIRHCSLQTKNRLLKLSRYLISEFCGGGGVRVTDCWRVENEKSERVEFSTSSPSGCAITSRTLMQVVSSASLFCGCVHNEFFLLYASPSYISNPLPRPGVSCLGAYVGGKRKKKKNLWLFKICFQHVSVPFSFFLLFFLTFAMLF